MRRRFAEVFDADRLYRNTRRAKLFGVCAGLADFWGVDSWMVRLGALLAVWLLTAPTLIVYFVLALFIDKRPEWSYY